jgi:hypothetical protein
MTPSQFLEDRAELCSLGERAPAARLASQSDVTQGTSQRTLAVSMSLADGLWGGISAKRTEQWSVAA